MRQPHAQGGPVASCFPGRIDVDRHRNAGVAGQVLVGLQRVQPFQGRLLGGRLIDRLVLEKLGLHADVFAGDEIEAVEPLADGGQFGVERELTLAALPQAVHFLQPLRAGGGLEEVLQESIGPSGAEIEGGARLDPQPRSTPPQVRRISNGARSLRARLACVSRRLTTRALNASMSRFLYSAVSSSFAVSWPFSGSNSVSRA